MVKEPQLHIVEVEKENIITVRDIEERSAEHHIDIQKANIVDKQTYVVPEKEVVFFEKPYAVTIEKPIQMKHEDMVIVEKPDTAIVRTREGLNEQIIKVITQDKLVAER